MLPNDYEWKLHLRGQSLSRFIQSWLRICRKRVELETLWNIDCTWIDNSPSYFCRVKKFFFYVSDSLFFLSFCKLLFVCRRPFSGKANTFSTLYTHTSELFDLFPISFFYDTIVFLCYCFWQKKIYSPPNKKKVFTIFVWDVDIPYHRTEEYHKNSRVYKNDSENWGFWNMRYRTLYLVATTTKYIYSFFVTL